MHGGTSVDVYLGGVQASKSNPIINSSKVLDQRDEFRESSRADNFMVVERS